ncbi:MarR family transcriptional regulator [Streptomyces sp. 135]|uniref:MarR family winged helix-turn-helix transcriptional regulator n=1 Tax=Streptomyces sp. 135 TaxID=2838850 RepID=UPI001CBCEE09|nr:MarR family transcriptional regulator [Streptomyces sp. 135]
MTHFTDGVEDFNRFYIRLPRRRKLPFSTLSVLDALAFDGSPKRLAELSAGEQLSQPGLTQLVQRLERDGLVVRGGDPRDGRAVLVHITEEGRGIGVSRRRERIGQLMPLVALLPPEDRRALAKAIPALERLAQLGRESAGAAHAAAEQHLPAMHRGLTGKGATDMPRQRGRFPGS